MSKRRSPLPGRARRHGPSARRPPTVGSMDVMETAGPGPVAIEIGQLERKYAGLRVADPGRQSRLTASLFEHGQQTPVLVVAQGPDRFVLIEGYARVSALEALSRDVVQAVVWPLSEAQALVLSHRLEATRRRSALEEAWLLRELMEVHGQSQPELALVLQRSTSWISRRLALVRVLPTSVQEAVRRGQVPVHAAMRSLVPLARAKRADCERLVERLEGRPISVRQMESLYLGWKTGDAEQRARLLEHPWLYLKAKDEARAEEPMAEPGEGARLEGMIEALVSLSRKTRQCIRRGALRRAGPRQRRSIELGWRELERSVAEIHTLIEEESDHARPRHPSGRPAPETPGALHPDHRPDPGALQELGQTGSA